MIWIRASSGSDEASTKPVAAIKCQPTEQFGAHYHAHLELIYDGVPVKVPGSIGIQATCIYWLHSHGDDGVIHVEAPKEAATRGFTLGDFFEVWGKPLSSREVATLKVGRDQQQKVFVDGTPYTGDPRKIAIKSHTQIVIEIGPPFTEPPPAFAWPDELKQ